MSSIYPRTRKGEMKVQTKREICRLIDEYMESIGATIVHAAKPGTEVPGTSGKEWSYMTRFDVGMRVSAHGQWVYMSFGYSNDNQVSELWRKRMAEILNSDARYNAHTGKYNLWVAADCKPADALSIFKGDMSLFICRKIENMSEERVKLDASYFIDKSERVFGKQAPARLAANAIRLLTHYRGYDEQSFLEHEEIIRQVMKTCLTDVAV